MSMKETLTDLQLMGNVFENYEGVKVRCIRNKDYLDAILKARAEAAKTEESENEQLLYELAGARADVFTLKSEIDDLVADIYRLSDLVARMYKAFQRAIPDAHRLDFEMEMRALGIEVEQ